MIKTRRIIRLILHYIVGVILAFALGKIVWYLCFIPEDMFDVCLFYVPTVILLIFFLAWPLGPPLAMYCLDKLIFKTANQSAWRILMGFLLGLGFAIIDIGDGFLGINIFGWAPLVKGVNIEAYLGLLTGTMFSLIGYNSLDLFKNISSKTHGLQTDKVAVEVPKKRWQIIQTEKFALIVLLSLIVIIFLLIICIPIQWIRHL